MCGPLEEILQMHHCPRFDFSRSLGQHPQRARIDADFFQFDEFSRELLGEVTGNLPPEKYGNLISILEMARFEVL
jgi:hypothetical protein